MKKRMRRITLIVIMVMVVCCLGGCGKKKVNIPTAPINRTVFSDSSYCYMFWSRCLDASGRVLSMTTMDGLNYEGNEDDFKLMNIYCNDFITIYEDCKKELEKDGNAELLIHLDNVAEAAMNYNKIFDGGNINSEEGYNAVCELSRYTADFHNASLK